MTAELTFENFCLRYTDGIQHMSCTFHLNVPSSQLPTSSPAKDHCV